MERRSRASLSHRFITILDDRADVGPLLTAFHESAERTGASRGLMPYEGSLLSNLVIWMRWLEAGLIAQGLTLAKVSKSKV
jgi:hypothetical protein